MFLKSKFFICLFTVFCVSNVLAECPDLDGHWTCDNDQKLKIRKEDPNGYDIFRFYTNKIHFVYTDSEDGSMPTVIVTSKTKVSVTEIGATCLEDSNGNSFLRVGAHANGVLGQNGRLLTDWSISDNDELIRNIHYTRDVTSSIGELESKDGRATVCTRKK